MDYFLDDDQKMIVELARKFAHEKIKPVREHYDETEEFPWPIMEELAKLDLCGIFVPQEYGGLGKTIFETVLLVEELSKVDGGIALTLAATGLGTFPIMLYGTEEQKKKYLPDIAKGKKQVSFAITEANSGSDVASMQTIAKKEGDYYILNGTKCFITSAGDSEIYTVVAMTDKTRGSRGASIFILEKGMEGFTFGKKEKKMGIRASSTRELVFNNCKVPRENLLGKEGQGFIIAMKTLDISRPGVASQALGIAAGALEDAVEYSRQRKQFGNPISSLQAIQHILADMATQVEAARALVYATAKMVAADMKTRHTRECAMSKLFASDVAMKVTVDAVQVYGGYGYMREYPMEKRMRDAKITQIYEGTNQVLRNEIAAALIKENLQKSSS
ncbi:MAG: acyl-CoA dehydrogenase [Elusimicrobia bacterium CG1_02_37_114]|nr:MAG: acyl-CoA dehydrogenase [Elusimicrobia bacterium CG1_02_37_114]PIV53296.1 MAG: acyl-CoA dehydrogenase [Elusimicrobia bacterium CG02_land_8_20_14_3_00_37_13]PIZ12830.1 MAG: acyl-CoA dehydrogenase [Elusimicrobia bacterium CG_4_10_14_0_8_um_filter_37_32]